MSRLTFDQLRAANIRRQAEWDTHGSISPYFRANEMGGEVGELQNVIKKLARIEYGLKGTSPHQKQDLLAQAAEEIGDVLICLDLVAMDFAEGLKSATPMNLAKDEPYHERLLAASCWLDSCTGRVSDAIDAGQLYGVLANSVGALQDVASLMKLDILTCAQMKFNMTSRKYGLKTLWEVA